MKHCDGISALHWPQILNDHGGAIVARCLLCGEIKVFRQDPDGRTDNRTYSEWFKRDIIQMGHPLYYKYHESMMNIT